MISSVIPVITRTGWVVVFVSLGLLLAFCVFHWWRRGYRRPLRALAMYGFWVFFAVIALLIIMPLPRISSDFCFVYRITEAPQTEPFKFMRDIGRTARYYNFSPRAVVNSFVFQQAFANAAVFVPLGVYMRFFTRRGFFVAVLAAFAATFVFEMTQGTGLYGIYPCPYRQFDVDDLILNTLGGAAGYIAAALVALPWQWLRPRYAANGGGGSN